LVHHGLFWRGQTGVVTGWMTQRLSLLLQHNINLFAYHLPLDAHPDLGNNAQLGLRLAFAPLPDGWGRFGDQNLGFMGLARHATAAELAEHVQQCLGRTVTLVGPAHRSVQRVAWCTGGAQGYFEAAIEAGADAFLTGEISEPQAHYARECGVAFFACGHHATERYGVQALGAKIYDLFTAIARKIGEVMALVINNPVSQTIGTVASAVTNPIGTAANMIGSVMPKFAGHIPNAANGLVAAANAEAKAMPSGARLVMANDSETIIPRGKTISGGRGGNTFNFNITGDNPDAIANKVMAKIQQAFESELNAQLA
jgi:dinuclear metal center YbgI/SA1388 family protein